MIKINLAVLLAERGLKITEVAKLTSISRTTLTALYYNHSKGVQFETLDVLCDFLKVKPDELILHERFAYEFTCTPGLNLSMFAEGGDDFPVLCNCKIIYNNEQINESFEILISVYMTDYDVSRTVETLSMQGRLPSKIETTLKTIPQLVKTDFFNALKDEVSFLFAEHFVIDDETKISLEIS